MINKNRGNLKQSNKLEKTLVQKIWLPLLVAIIDLGIIILLVFLFKSAIAIVAVVVLGHLIFLIYLTKTLEREKISREKEIKARLGAEQKAREEREKSDKEKELRLKAEQKIQQKPKQQPESTLIPRIINFEDLKKYISITLKQKFPPQEIKNALINVGWSEEKIDQAFHEVLK